jgi:threonine/homoserine/homoserine lactone efflux protein
MQEPTFFVLTVLLILGTPGPTNMLLAAGGGTVGFRRALRLVPAEASGYLVTILIVGLVIGPVIASAPAVALGMRVVVGAYLVTLAAKLWRQTATDPAVAPVTPGQVFLTTLLNPKALVFALGVVPFGASNWWLYLLCFLLLLVTVAMGWIALGATLARAACATGGHGRLALRLSAAGIGIFAVALLMVPLLH